MPSKTRAVLLAENERLRSKVREIYAAYYDMHKAWERAEDNACLAGEVRHSKWREEEMRAEIDGLKEQITRLKAAKKKKTPAKV